MYGTRGRGSKRTTPHQPNMMAGRGIGLRTGQQNNPQHRSRPWVGHGSYFLAGQSASSLSSRSATAAGCRKRKRRCATICWRASSIICAPMTSRWRSAGLRLPASCAAGLASNDRLGRSTGGQARGVVVRPAEFSCRCWRDHRLSSERPVFVQHVRPKGCLGLAQVL
jgi:hypothetical protein